MLVGRRVEWRGARRKEGGKEGGKETRMKDRKKGEKTRL